MTHLKILLSLLSQNELSRLWLLLAMMVVTAVLDVLGIVSILPFMAVLADPGLIVRNDILSKMNGALGFTDSTDFLIFLGFLVFCFLSLSLSLKALATYAQIRFVMMREYSIGHGLVERYLNQPYSWFLNRNSAELGKTVLSEVSGVVNYGLMPMLTLASQGIASLAVLVLLILVDPTVALSVSLTLATIYGVVVWFTTGMASRFGHDRLRSNNGRFSSVSEAFGASKEIKLAGLESVYLRRFADPARSYAETSALVGVLAQTPRYLLEFVAFGGMLSLILVLMIRGNANLATALPMLSLYALAAYRLMPALQQIYAALTQLRFAGAALDALQRDLTSLDQAPRQVASQRDVGFEREIRLNRVDFTYPGAGQPAIRNLNLAIMAKSIVGFVGATGGGKTTTVDLILGLLLANEGSLTVDGVPIDDSNRRQWQRLLGYVPQQIYLADDSIAANIAFGVPREKMDMSSVERAAKVAEIHDFIIKDLPNGYEEKVGERGVRLSGGQRQRIGIARALYRNPKVLILDEATSALDNSTEKAVMDAVNNLAHSVTLIIVAHRLTTVAKCDRVFILDRGRLVGEGAPAELAASNDFFRRLSRAQESNESLHKMMSV